MLKDARIVAIGLMVVIFGLAKITSKSFLAQAVTMSLSQINYGQVVRIGSRDFVKITEDLYQATAPLSFIQDFVYTGSVQEWIVPYTGVYRIELWGAKGGSVYGDDDSTNMYGWGGYVSGEILLLAGESYYFYIGNRYVVVGGSSGPNGAAGYNGGGSSGNGVTRSGAGGGGATDMRLVNGVWNDAVSLRSRILVAGAGGANQGASRYNNGDFFYAGGLTGYHNRYYTAWATGGSQTAGGSVGGGTTYFFVGYPGAFGVGGNGSSGQGAGSGRNGGGGGGGYYGGGGGSGASAGADGATGAGGSSYISGHTGCVAITSAADQAPKSGCTTGTTDNNCSIHYSGKVFTNTVMIDGAGYAWTNAKGTQQQMPNPAGGFYATGVGHTGNGAARITLI